MRRTFRLQRSFRPHQPDICGPLVQARLYRVLGFHHGFMRRAVFIRQRTTVDFRREDAQNAPDPRRSRSWPVVSSRAFHSGRRWSGLSCLDRPRRRFGRQSASPPFPGILAVLGPGAPATALRAAASHESVQSPSEYPCHGDWTVNFGSPRSFHSACARSMNSRPGKASGAIGYLRGGIYQQRRVHACRPPT